MIASDEINGILIEIPASVALRALDILAMWLGPAPTAAEPVKAPAPAPKAETWKREAPPKPEPKPEPMPVAWPKAHTPTETRPEPVGVQPPEIKVRPQFSPTVTKPPKPKGHVTAPPKRRAMPSEGGIQEHVRQAVALLEIDPKAMLSGRAIRSALELIDAPDSAWATLATALRDHPNVDAVGEGAARRYQWRAAP